MPYRWKTKVDVDEAVVVIMNVLGQEPGPAELADCHDQWLNSGFRQKIAEYFFEEVKKHIPAALKYFESRE